MSTARTILQLAAQYSFSLIRHRRYLIFQHPSGAIISTPKTPSDRRSIRNVEAGFRRIDREVGRG